MTTPLRRLRPSTARERRRGLLAVAVVLLLAAALGLTTRDSTSDVIDEGDTLDLSSPLHGGSSHEVRVPRARIDLRVGGPVDEVAGGLVAGLPAAAVDPVRPEQGSHLVPVTSRLRPIPDVMAPPEPDTQVITIGLVHDDTTVALSSGTAEELQTEPGRSTVAAVDEDADLDDITIEVEYDGLTQVLSPDSGDIESGAAAPLYEEATSLSAGCDGLDGCHLTAIGRRTPWRPLASEAELTTGPVVTRPHDEGLGWADEGNVWASVDVAVDEPTLVGNVDGAHRDANVARGPTVTLDQSRPRQVSNLRADRRPAIFSIDADSSPRKLTIEQGLALMGSEAPRKVTLRKTMKLDEAQ